MIRGLILAAGESSRMGTDKALLQYRGHTFLEHVITTLREAEVHPIVVVLGHHAEEIQRAIDLSGVEVVVNPDYRRGQTASLQAGLRQLESPDLEAIVLSLVDHPTVSPKTVWLLVQSFRRSQSPVVIPTTQGRRGHPVLVGRALFEELKQIRHEEGANSVVRKYRDKTEFVEVDDPGILLDIDSPETFARLEGGGR